MENQNHRNRLKQSFVLNGIDAFHDYEILELLLTYVIKRKDTKQIAKNLIKSCGSLDGVFSECIKELDNIYKNNYIQNPLVDKKKITKVIKSTSDKLSNIDGFGDESLILLSLIAQITSKLYKEFLIDSNINLPIKNTSTLINYLRSVLSFENVEKFYIIYLDTQNKVIGIPMEFKGTLDKSYIYIREIVKNILRYDAKSVVFVHNHPSGNLAPSSSDIEITKKLISALSLFDITVLDHIIISKYGFKSFLAEGLI